MLGRCIVLVAATALALPATSAGGGGRYRFDGGTKTQQETVAAALRASSFNWSLVPGPVVIHVLGGVPSHSLPGEIWLDADLLDAGEFAWGVVQHEYAHQVDYLVLEDPERALLLLQLGGRDWCYGEPGLAHDQYGCERFASTLAWSFWPSPNNSMRPVGRGDESAAMAPARFRALVTLLTSRRTERPARSG